MIPGIVSLAAGDLEKKSWKLTFAPFGRLC
jgi:hypothetical protein